MRGLLTALAVLASVLVGYVWLRITPPPADRSMGSPTSTSTSTTVEDVRSLERQGLLKRLSVADHAAHVDPTLWAGLNADAKRSIIMTLSRHIEHERKTGHVKVYDSRNGRLIAEYSVWSGVTLK